VTSATVEQDVASKFLLYYSMVLFFQNGGGPCYVVSVGTYDGGGINDQDLTDGIETLLKEQEPTMVVIPDAVLLPKDGCIKVQQAALKHCGDTKSRFAILDVYDGYKDRKDPPSDCIADFRDKLGTDQLDYGAAYYPWLKTSIVAERELGCQNISSLGDLKAVLGTDTLMPKGVIGTIPSAVPAKQIDLDLLNKTLAAVSPLFVRIRAEIRKQINLLPPSGAIAGVIARVDNAKGVWKAPANESLSSVDSPAVNISAAEQEDLNITPQGKSINAIRSFVGEGTLVWGARTLDGNSGDWKYINVRRTMIWLEESIKTATKAYVFENNVSTTWVTIKSMIRNFLTSVWKRGGLQGAVPDDAFQVFCGLGETMTPQDILDGYLRVTVLVALIHPAEFIEITFQQQMAKS
jgi:phage tail sheath protein FI